MNPYEILGIARDATDAAIKHAYRCAAQKTHPDKSGGDEGKFVSIQNAYELLSDPDRRAYFDQHGEDRGQVDAQSAVLAELAALFDAVMNDPETRNPVEKMSEVIQAEILNQQGHKITKKGRVSDLEDACSRITYTGTGGNVLTGVLDRQISVLNRGIQGCDDRIVHLKAMVERLCFYSYRADPQPETEQQIDARNHRLLRKIFGGIS